MKKMVLMLASVGLLAGSIAVASPVWAGEISNQGAKVTWDDSRFYAPSGCSRFTFNYVQDPGVNFSTIGVLNRYGDSLGSSVTDGTSGQAEVQICSSDLDGSIVRLKTVWRSANGGNTFISELPITFLSRTPAAPAAPAAESPSVSQPKPKSVKCISKKTFKKKTFKGKTKCPSGWVKI